MASVDIVAKLSLHKGRRSTAVVYTEGHRTAPSKGFNKYTVVFPVETFVFVLIFALVFVFHTNESYCLLQRNNGLGGHVLSANDLHINEPGLRSGISRLGLYRDTRRSSETQNRASAGTYHCLERPIDANE